MLKLNTVKIVGYRKLRDIPDDLFHTLCNDVTMWRMGGLMRGRAELYRARNVAGPLTVAMIGDSPVGWMFVDLSDSVEMCVRPEFRRKGIATELLVALSVLTQDHDKSVYNRDAEQVQLYAKADLMRRFAHIPWRPASIQPRSW